MRIEEWRARWLSKKLNAKAKQGCEIWVGFKLEDRTMQVTDEEFERAWFSPFNMELSLPPHNNLTVDDVDKVIDCVKKGVGKCN